MPPNVQKHIQDIEEAVSASANMMRKTYGPAWDAQAGLAKIVISVSAAIFGAVLAFSPQIFDAQDRASICLALVAMASLMLSLGFCILSLYASTELTSFQARQFNRRPELRRRISELDETAHDFDQRLEDVWKPMLNADLEPIGTAADRSKFCLTVGVATFLCALLLFIVILFLRYGGT